MAEQVGEASKCRHGRRRARGRSRLAMFAPTGASSRPVLGVKRWAPSPGALLRGEAYVVDGASAAEY